MPKSIEALARYLNQISQNETHFDDCPAKVKNAYRDKAKWILEWLAAQTPEPNRAVVQSEESILSTVKFYTNRESCDQELLAHTLYQRQLPYRNANYDLTDAQINDACLSYRHDFGLMGPLSAKTLRDEAKEWGRAILKALQRPAAPKDNHDD